jgi:hypothetical protein
MTSLLQQAFAQAAKLTVAEQDLLAERLLAELAAEEAFDNALANSAERLVEMAQSALEEHRAGLTQPLDPDKL